MSYDSKNSVVGKRQLQVQELSIPLTIAGNAVPASVVCRNDEPSVLFLQTEGVDQITGALDTNETATYTTAPSDVGGIFRMLVKVQESLDKVVGGIALRRDTGENIPVYLGSATGITTGSGGGKSIMLIGDSALALNAANTLDCSLVIKYIVAE